MSHPVENIMRSTMEQLRQMVDVNTIVGSPVGNGQRNGAAARIEGEHGLCVRRRGIHNGSGGYSR